MVQRFARFFLATSEISRYLHKIAAEEMAPYGLKGTHCIYLIALYQAPEGITAARLGELCGRDKAEVSRMISILREKGLVSAEGPGYRARLTLTEAGRAASGQVQQRSATAVELGGRGLSEEKREAMYEALELIGANLRTLSRDGLPAR